MKKAPVIILAALLAIALILIVNFYLQNENKKAELTKSNEMIGELEKGFAELNDKLEVSENRLSESAETLETFRNQVNRLSELEVLIEQQNNTIQQLTKSIETWQADYELLEKNYKKSLSELEMANSQMVKMRKEHESIKSTLTQEANERQQIFQDQLAERKQKLQEQQNNMQQIEASMDVLMKNYQNTLDQYRQAKKDIDRLQSEKNQLHQRIVELTNKISNMEKQVSNEQNKMKNQEEHMKQVEVTYENLLTELHDEIEKKEAALQQIEEGFSITFVDKILFDFGQAQITEEGQHKLLKVANILSKNKNKKIRIIGHSDNIPIAKEYRYKFPSNWELSAARAAAVVRFFIEKDIIDGNNLEAVGQAYYKPIATNETPEGRSLNRRVEILITPI